MQFISTKAHTVIGLVVGALLIVAPYLLGFSDNTAATVVPMIIGAFIILNELITTSPLSLVKLIPMKMHIILDVVTGLVLAISPWLFGFFSVENPIQWVPHLVVGIMVMGYALLTTTADERDRSIVAS
jgi:hypothetical protein